MDYKGYFYIMSRQTGMVLDVYEANTASSTPIIVYPKKTEGAENQLWRYNSETGELESRLNGYRIDVSGGSAYNSASIINYPENNAVNQKWYFRDDGSIESGLGKQWVLDVQGADTNAGTKIILYERKDGGPSINQQFDVVPYVPADGFFYIRSALNDCYLQIKDGSDLTSAPICIGNRADGDRKFQRWKYNKETSAICSELNDYAIDVRQANAANSAEIISYPCHGGNNQGWTFEKNGSIVSGMGSTWVLDDAAGGGAGTNVILYTWHGGKNQQWYISTE
ncbi:seed lectin-like [Branchiostoma floridae]|uniref:Seed lectin-like n=1 Tax=Branchiostoma floridae TaxID=7739 RepID=A0A9J7HJ39_BRAFL|nr:seed lectin-like [Branchiostoma floridae]XP_035660376.1 seed lectin-like [Branchiostoma floridae]